MATDMHTTLSLDAQALIDALPDATLIIDELCRVECTNKAAERLLGFSRNDIAKNKINFLFSARDGAPLTATTPDAIPVEVIANRKHGDSFVARLSCTRVANSSPRRFVLSVRSADLLNELQPRAMKMTRLAVMGDMAACMAHELNQPLTAIANYAQAVKWMIDSPPHDVAEINESLKEITTQAIRASEVIRRLRTLIQQGEETRVSTTINSVIDEIKVLLTTEARLQSVHIVFDLAPDLPGVKVDRIQIQQVLLSLIRNSVTALESIPREQREIKLTTRLHHDGTIEVSVADTGTGINVALEQQLFATGLGLPIVKTIVQAHGGALGYKPNEPRGACFSFRLPAAKGR